VDKQKIIKIIFIILSVVLFLFLLISSIKKAIIEVSKKANATVQVFASNRAQMIFNEDVFRSYRLCKKREKTNKKINDYIKYCGTILNEVSIPDEGYLTNISHKFYHYNWRSANFSNKYGRVVYIMNDKDKYLKSGQCFLMLANRFGIAIFKSFLLSVLFYFALILIKKLFTTVLKTTRIKIICGGLILMFLCWYYAYQYNMITGGSGDSLALLNGGLSLVGDIPVILKIMITILASLIVYKEYKICKYGLWTIGFVIIAFIFNPLIPVIPFLSVVGITRVVNTLCEIFFFIYLVKEYKSFNA